MMSRVVVVKDLITVVFASALWYQNIFFSFWQLRPLYYFKKIPLDYF